MTWREFWDRECTTYINERHRQLESELIGRAIETFIPHGTASILDYGCGDNRVADEVAQHCRKLILCDTAPSLLKRLRQRYAQNPKISVMTPGELHALPSGLIDLTVANSLIQYLGSNELHELLGLWRRTLKSEGLLVIGDVIPTNSSDVRDAMTLLRFGWEGGFLFAAIVGLFRILLSDYRKLRRDHGLFKYNEADLVAIFA
ncbi:MAG TPA: methyltransferase domain-containing protein, partial [Dongiaceae bacterium]